MIAGATFYPEIFSYATDQFRNIVGFSRAVTWRVISGPIAPSVLNSTTDRNGRAQIQLTSTGTAGIAVLRLEFQSAPEVFLDMTVDVRGAGAIDYIEGWLSPGSGASLSRSGHNGSHRPTVDTINAGETVIWALPNFDYDQHRITITNGTISLTSGTWWWGQTLDSATLSTPGTYHYVDAFHSTVYGTVVVK
jgi:plastocyanin